MSGRSPLPRSVARCMTPNRCCSSMTASPSAWNVDVLLHERVRADDQVDRARRDLPRSALARDAAATPPVSSATGSASPPAAARIVAEVLLGQDLGGRHEGDLRAVLHRERAPPAAPRWSCPSRRRPAAAGSSAGAAACPRRYPSAPARWPPVRWNGSTLRSVSRMRSSTWIVKPLRSASRFAPPQQQADLKAEEFFQDQPPLRRRSKRVEHVERRRRPAGSARGERVVPRRQPQCAAHVGRQGHRQIAASRASASATSFRCIFGVIDRARS